MVSLHPKIRGALITRRFGRFHARATVRQLTCQIGSPPAGGLRSTPAHTLGWLLRNSRRCAPSQLPGRPPAGASAISCSFDAIEHARRARATFTQRRSRRRREERGSPACSVALSECRIAPSPVRREERSFYTPALRGSRPVRSFASTRAERPKFPCRASSLTRRAPSARCPSTSFRV